MIARLCELPADASAKYRPDPPERRPPLPPKHTQPRLTELRVVLGDGQVPDVLPAGILPVELAEGGEVYDLHAVTGGLGADEGVILVDLDIAPERRDGEGVELA